MSFKTKLDFGNDNRQAKQMQFSEIVLSGKTTFGVTDNLIPENFTGDTINIDSLQNIQTRGIIFPNSIPEFTGATAQTLGRDNATGKLVAVSGGTGDVSSGLETLDSGWAFINDDRTKKGVVGSKSVDMTTYFDGLLTDYGPAGNNSLLLGNDMKSIGNNNLGIGYQSILNGYSAVSFGDYNEVGGGYNLTSGHNNINNSWGGIAVGRNNTISSYYSSTFGQHNTISGYTSTSFGGWNTVSGDYSIVFGAGNDMQSTHSCSSGFGNVISTDAIVSLSYGYENTLNGYSSFVGGTWTDESSDTLGYNFVGGQGTTLNGAASIGWGPALTGTNLMGCAVFGSANASVPSVTNGSNGTNPMIIVGNGTHITAKNAPWWSGATRSNLLVGLRNGEVTLPSTTIAVISGETSGKILVTREYLESYALTGETVDLSGYIPYTGATQTVDLNNNNISGGTFYSSTSYDDLYSGDTTALITIDYGDTTYFTRRTLILNATTVHTVTPANRSEVIRFTTNSTINVTINSDSLDNIGDIAEIDQWGAGDCWFIEGTATLLINSKRLLVTDGQYSRVAIQKMTETEYRVYGELEIA